MADAFEYDDEIQCCICFEVLGFVGHNDEVEIDLNEVPFLCNGCKAKTD